MNHKRRRIINFILGSIVILSCLIVLAISFAIKNSVDNNSPIPSPEPTNKNSIAAVISNLPSITDGLKTQPKEEGNTTPPFIDLQPTVDVWIKTLSSNESAAIMIYDINNNRTAANINANQVFQVASIYKLLFAYDGYRQITNGLEDPDTIVTTTKSKGTITLSRCLDLIIRESYNGCADVMNRDQKRITRVNRLIKELEMNSTSNIGLNSTAADITKLLIQYWKHDDLDPTLWSKISDSMLNQPPSLTEDSELYDWRQGLPAGFSDHVKVYNKVGWDWNGETWNIYADAAILEFTTLNRVYTAVVLTSNLSNYSKITNLGRMIESAVESGE